MAFYVYRGKRTRPLNGRTGLNVSGVKGGNPSILLL